MTSNEPIIKALNLPVRVSMRQPVTVSISEPVSGVMYRMIGNDIGAVIVVEKEKPVGIITEKDLLERVIMEQKDVHKTPANDIMSKPVISIEAGRLIKEALDLMRKHNIRRLAVTENESLIGIVTERRLLREFLNQII